ncbi:glucose-1-phosphate thymidylyltransferase [Flammeovirga kamogawensis]|nr:glucose-1-phosphate thymidylyltransferase [Flammeovirga kamogawensis]
MMNIILFDNPTLRVQLLPFTFIRPVADIRVGIFKIYEKWERALKCEVSFLTEDYLQGKFPVKHGSEQYYINGSLCPNPSILKRIEELKEGQGLVCGKEVLVLHTSTNYSKMTDDPEEFEKIEVPLEEVSLIQHPWDIFTHNREQIILDFEEVTKGRISHHIEDPHTVVYGRANIFVEEGVEVRAAILNAQKGPIYIGKNAVIEEGVIIQGTCAIGEGTRINMGAKIREDCSFGPHCKVGGEINNSVIFGYSNKAHDGFLGNSVVGEWCNLGADTNTSNLKNNYGPVRIWSYEKSEYVSTQQQFCGMMMADYCKAGINTMFNTGTVVGVSAHIFGGGFPPKHIPSFAWGAIDSKDVAQLDKMVEIAERVFARRKADFTVHDRQILQKVFELSKFDRE